MITILLNGQPHRLEKEVSVAEFLQQLSLPSQAFALSINQQIIPRSQFERVFIQATDQVEIVHPVGGG